jgi:hypothetical protein
VHLVKIFPGWALMATLVVAGSEVPSVIVYNGVSNFGWALGGHKPEPLSPSALFPFTLISDTALHCC